MRRLYIYIAITLLSIGGAQALPIEIEGLKLKSEILGQEVLYSVILPDGYESSSINYPVLYMLHGIGGDHSSWLEYSSPARLMQRMVQSGEISPFIMVIPDGYQSYYSNSFDSSFNYESMFLEELLPTIDASYRTIDRREARAIVGFSMGGFGSLSIAIRNRDRFSAVVALSPSIRTEAQYCSESPQSGWDYQWGRIFGGVGVAGEDRLTDYYLSHSPLSLLSSLSASDLEGLEIMIDTGDQEWGIARSSEALHTTMSERGIPHIWEVRAGGHDFSCWNSALPKAFRLFSDNFKQYGLNTPEARVGNVTHREIVELKESKLYYPFEAEQSTRLYPTIFIDGYSGARASLVESFDLMVERGESAPYILCFVDPHSSLLEAIDEAESQPCSKMRSSRRFRALISTGDSVESLCEALERDQLCAVIVSVASSGNRAQAAKILTTIKAQEKRPKIFIEAGDILNDGPFAGELHSLMRDDEHYHQYRSRWDTDSDIFSHWSEWIEFIHNTKN